MIATPPEVTFHTAQRLFTWHPYGVLDSDVTSKIISFLEFEEEEMEEPFNRFTDLTHLMAIELDIEYVVRASMHRRRVYAGREPVKSAFLATTPEAIRIAKVHEILTEQSPLHVLVFTNLAEAAEWLGVPLDLLRE